MMKVVIKPDFGLHLLRLGLALDKDGKKTHQVFVTVDVHFVARIDDTTYALNSYLEMDGLVFLATFDFAKELLPQFLSCLEPKEVAEAVSKNLTSYPFKWKSEPHKVGFVGLSCKIGDFVNQNKNEHYSPFTVDKFL